MDAGELAELRKRFEEASKGSPVILTRLPRRVRLRLWLTGRLNHAGVWLVEHGHCDAAERLWRVCGLW